MCILLFGFQYGALNSDNYWSVRKHSVNTFTKMFSRQLLPAHWSPLAPPTHCVESKWTGRFRWCCWSWKTPISMYIHWLCIKHGPIRTLWSHLDHLATFHLHQLTEVLLQQAGVGAPLQQAQQIHWEEKERKKLTSWKKKVSAFCLYFNSTFTLQVNLSGAHFNRWQALHNSLFLLNCRNEFSLFLAVQAERCRTEQEGHLWDSKHSCTLRLRMDP